MKETLALRMKRQFLLFVLVGAVCGALCIGMNFLYPSFRILYIAGACVFFLAMLFDVVGLCMPRTVAEREGEELVLHLGLRTRRIPVSDLLSFDVPEKDAGAKDGPVIVSFREGGQERRLALLSVEDREEGLARLRALLPEKKK